MLASAVGQLLSKHITSDILELLFSCGLSKDLNECLTQLLIQIPPLQSPIRDRLLDMISLTLSGGRFQPPGSPNSAQKVNVTIAKEYREVMLTRDGLSSEGTDDDLIVLALDILGTFDFKGHSLSEFVKTCAIFYIDHANPRVRKAAALNSCHLYIRDPICYQVSARSLRSVSEVIEKLLHLAVSDPVGQIRLEVLCSLESRLDPHLSQAENVRILFMALNDEIFTVRRQAMTIIGRLSRINPAYVVPSLRKTLIQLLTELEFASSSTNKEESSKLLALLISMSSSLVKPYLKPILATLVPRARDQNPSVAASVIAALGELSKVGGEEMKPFHEKLMKLLLDTLQDQSSTIKRDAALKTLGQLSSSSGYVIDPLLDYPQLLSILVSILKSSDQNMSLKRETVRVMGILGALDPYKRKEVERSEDNNAESDSTPIDILLLMQGTSPSADEYYPTVVITTLMGLLKDPSLVTHHNVIAQAVIHIFKSLGLKCVPFLDQIVPGLLGVIRSSNHIMAEFIFRQLSNLVVVVKQHTRTYLGSIFEVVQEYFCVPSLQPVILSLINSIAQALDGEFKAYVPRLLPLLIGIIQNDKSRDRYPSINVLNSFIIFGSNIEDHAHLIIPSIVNMFEYTPVNLRIAAVNTLGELCRIININDMTSRIIHPLLRILDKGPEELRKPCIDTICALCFSMGSEFATFIPVINAVLHEKKIHARNYEILVAKLQKGEPLPQNLNPHRKMAKLGDELTPTDFTTKKLNVNHQHLQMAWDTSQRTTREDWMEWLRKFSLELLKESPSAALRASANIAGVYAPLAKDLFNTSFYSCWGILHDTYKEDLVKSLETALTSPNIPPEVLQTLLNLAEYMEHDEKSLPIDIRTLAQYAQKCHAYAKALHYKEQEFLQDSKTSTIESLIGINNQLQQSDSAIGVLTNAQQLHELKLKETWYEKLQRWDDALEAYNRREKDHDSMEVTMGKMRCLHALGEWEQLSKLAQERWTNSTNDIKRAVAPLAAAAAWGLSQWDRMDTYISVMKQESPDRSFFNAILYIHRGQFEEASKQIILARDLLATELTALISESYNRAYGVVVRVQMLAELEEIITYKNLPADSDTRRTMRNTWTKRLKGCQQNVDIWQRMLKVRALVIKPKEDMDMWIKFANLCRKSGRLGLAEKSLHRLLEPDENEASNGTVTFYPKVVYAQLKYMWSMGSHQESLDHLIEFTSEISHSLQLQNDDLIAQPLPSERPDATEEVIENTKLLARCFLKQGEWRVALRDSWRTEDPDTILGSYLLATHFDKNWYKAWHNWALANFEFISMYEASKNLTPTDITDLSSARLVQHHIVPAIQGFFKSISLNPDKSMQDTLRLLTLWFNYGGLQEPAKAINEGFLIVRIEIWLGVVPQLISRIHQSDHTVAKALHGLLAELGRAHPHALIYPLTVAIKSDSVSRQKAASNIIDKMRMHHPVLIEQAELVSFELIRVAVLWHELWHEALEDASRFYFGDHNVEKMYATLDPLHALLDKGPQTLREISFQTAFARDLNDAYSWVNSFRRTNDPVHLNQAWEIYYNVFRRISRQLPQPTALELQHVSPKLLSASNLQLAVPGTYAPGKPVITISKFDPTLSVIASKQRPRRLALTGSDGKKYEYVLKGHEDIRQDNLVMQLFGLVNTLLADDPECFKRHLNIQQYAAIPLSPKVGLLGWVPHSDTFHVLIKEYREGKILLNIEYRVMLQMAPDYDSLTHLQKIEVFTFALDNTRGQDLYRVLWLKSRSSEAWLDRRTQYTRSLAVMSMVGYILGLGDRHPSNLMLDRYTGKVIHIDFGDCFEAAILREKYPEKVPFRLTRMLTFAMEVSGIEGSFRITCEHVMSLLRENKESLMAILEAFAYDPLINWGFDIPTKGDQSTLTNNLPDGGFLNGENRFLTNDAQNMRRPSTVITSSDPDDMKKNLAQQKSYAVRNARARVVLRRITDKLTGNDFKGNKDLDVPSQVNRLIQQATNIENLCLHYIGWCSFW